MTVGRLCNREVVITGRESSAAEAARLMREFHVGDLVIVEAGEARKPVGLVTDRDVVVEVVAAGLDPESVSVADLITRPVATITEDTDFWEALAQMRKEGVRRMPVVSEAGGLEGIFTLDDALGLLAEASSNLVALVSREIDQEERTRKG